LINGAENFRWVLWLHGIGGYAVAVVLIWKGVIIVHAWLRRRRPALPRLGFLVLTLLVLAILATGWMWIVVGRTDLWGFSLMTIHALLAIALLALLIWHTLYMRFVFRVPSAKNRRAFLRLVGASVGGLLIWPFAERTVGALNLPGAKRRFTGSYETGSFTGVFPEVSWLFDRPGPVDPRRWRLVIEGVVERSLALTYEQLEQLVDDRRVTTLDCTGGWYSTQEWQGVRVARLLDMAGVRASARSITFEAVSGYGRRFALDEARSLILAMRVAGQPLEHGHGFPARLVAVNHRGFDWVKWVARIRVNESSEIWQPPVPLQ
ncbi:MAG: molybdopterin-dependent oxidoreductase, partial [Anaerolineales bacterium]